MSSAINSLKYVNIIAMVLKRIKRILLSIFVLILAFQIVIETGKITFADSSTTSGIEFQKEDTDSLNLAKSFPENKVQKKEPKSFLQKLGGILRGTGMPISNVGVKLYFSANHRPANVTAKELQKDNAKLFQFYGVYKGKKNDKKLTLANTKVFFSPRDKNYILAEISIGALQLKSDSEYKLVIRKGLKSDDGNVLKKDEVITFKTVNSDLNNKVYMGLMVVMFVGMFGFMALKNKKKKAKEGTSVREKEEKVNPYQIAKKTGKPVEQVIKELEKKRIKDAKKQKSSNDDYRGKLFKVHSKKGTKEIGIVYQKGIKKTNPNKQNQHQNKNKSKKKKKKK